MWKAFKEGFMEGFKQGYVGTNNTYQLEERYQAKRAERKVEYEMMKAEMKANTQEFKAAWSEFKAVNKRIANELKEEWNK
jgi:hypothetical protein